jgi:phosphoglycolate phosphatase-like HAD superfamily hydrolase
MRPTVLLFDIDGTLVTTGGAGRRAMERSFGALYGRPEAIRFRMDGLTDRLIVRRAFEAIGVTPLPEDIDRVLSAYLEVLRDEVVRVPDEVYRVHVGMQEALERAREHGAAVGLGTGNIHEGARVKLERVRLFEHFSFGGYGSDAEDRTELIRIGAVRGAAELGAEVTECRVVVIGDTPKDVLAAQGIGAECLGVGTGTYSVEALTECGATWAFPSLASEGAIEALLGSSERE